MVNVVTPTDIFVNNQVPVNPIITNYINKYLPSSNVAGTNNFVASPVTSIRQDRFVIEIDYNVSTRDTLSFVYQFQRSLGIFSSSGVQRSFELCPL